MAVDELLMIRESLLRCADTIVEAYESEDSEAGFLAFRATESEVAQYIVRLFELDVLTSLKGIDDAVRRYNETNAEDLDFAGSEMSNRDMTLFDEVIGYELWARNLGPGLIRAIGQALPSIVSESQRQYSLFAPRQIRNAIRLLATLIPISVDSTAEASSAAEPLSENQSTILQTMFELSANVNRVFARSAILKRAGLEGDNREAFERLTELGLILAKRGAGQYLTDLGQTRGEEIHRQNTAPR